MSPLVSWLLDNPERTRTSDLRLKKPLFAAPGEPVEVLLLLSNGPHELVSLPGEAVDPGLRLLDLGPELREPGFKTFGPLLLLANFLVWSGLTGSAMMDR